MRNKVFPTVLLLLILSVFGCYPEEMDMITVTEVDMPIDTVFVSEGVSKFTILESEYSREAFGRYCTVIDEFTGETTTETLISNGHPAFDEGLFLLELNDIAIIESGTPESQFIIIRSDVTGADKWYRSMGESSNITFTLSSETEIRGTWEGVFEVEITPEVWEEFGIISGEFFVPVIDVNCQ